MEILSGRLDSGPEIKHMGSRILVSMGLNRARVVAWGALAARCEYELEIGDSITAFGFWGRDGQFLMKDFCMHDQKETC